jgi:acyl carrier protein
MSTPPPQRLATVLASVRQEAATVLGLPGPAKLDVRRGLRDAGLDSLMAVELRNRLQAAVGRALPATVAFDYPTVEDLARYLALEILGVELEAPALGDGQADGSAMAADAVEELSDDEAEAQLNAELAALAHSRRGGGDA